MIEVNKILNMKTIIKTTIGIKIPIVGVSLLSLQGNWLNMGIKGGRLP
jgi:hypothetical protein